MVDGDCGSNWRVSSERFSDLGNTISSHTGSCFVCRFTAILKAKSALVANEVLNTVVVEQGEA